MFLVCIHVCKYENSPKGFWEYKSLFPSICEEQDTAVVFPNMKWQRSACGAAMGESGKLHRQEKSVMPVGYWEFGKCKRVHRPLHLLVLLFLDRSLLYTAMSGLKGVVAELILPSNLLIKKKKKKDEMLKSGVQN